MGLSPRLRGNDLFRHVSRSGIGSIPALAGERITQRVNQPPTRVYPRACGGTRRWQIYRLSGQGLSPRLRGNAAGNSPPPAVDGSIPALAGERCPFPDGR